MLRLPVSKLKDGMVLGQSLFNTAGGSYLVKGQPVTIDYIRRMQQLGIQSVTVTSMDPRHKLPPPPDVIEEKTRVNAIIAVYNTFQSIEENGTLDIPALQKVTDSIVFNLFENHENLVQLTDIRTHDAYTFAHSVNVAVLSAMMGMLCHLPKEDLSLITLGGLLHEKPKSEQQRVRHHEEAPCRWCTAHPKDARSPEIEHIGGDRGTTSRAHRWHGLSPRP